MTREARTRKGLLDIVPSDEEAVVLEQQRQADVSTRSSDALGDAAEEVVEPLDLLADSLLGAEEQAELSVKAGLVAGPLRAPSKHEQSARP